MQLLLGIRAHYHVMGAHQYLEHSITLIEGTAKIPQRLNTNSE